MCGHDAVCLLLLLLSLCCLFVCLFVVAVVVVVVNYSLKQNEAQSVRAESTHKGVN